MINHERPTPDEANAVREQLAALEKAAELQTVKLRPLAARCDQVGIENVEWYVLIEMAARGEMLRRIHEDIARGWLFLGLEPARPTQTN